MGEAKRMFGIQEMRVTLLIFCFYICNIKILYVLWEMLHLRIHAWSSAMNCAVSVELPFLDIF